MSYFKCKEHLIYPNSDHLQLVASFHADGFAFIYPDFGLSNCEISASTLIKWRWIYLVCVAHSIEKCHFKKKSSTTSLPETSVLVTLYSLQTSLTSFLLELLSTEEMVPMKTVDSLLGYQGQRISGMRCCYWVFQISTFFIHFLTLLMIF